MTFASGLLILLITVSGCDAQALLSIADVTIIDRDSGVVLSPHYFRGDYWVAGTPGARYAIEIHNKWGERLLAVASVDGINVVSGATAGWDQAGYVVDPGERYQITGWRKTDADVAAFRFADAANSYAARTGRPVNVGVIGVAVFRERQPLGVHPRFRQSPSASARANALAAPAAKLGTAHGEREYSYVERTEFVRMQDQPNEIIRIHYDSLDNLVAMGVIKRPHAAPAPDPFPASPGNQYVPDPPG